MLISSIPYQVSLSIVTSTAKLVHYHLNLNMSIDTHRDFVCLIGWFPQALNHGLRA